MLNATKGITDHEAFSIMRDEGRGRGRTFRINMVGILDLRAFVLEILDEFRFVLGGSGLLELDHDYNCWLARLFSLVSTWCGAVGGSMDGAGWGTFWALNGLYGRDSSSPFLWSSIVWMNRLG
jgi:hypothetical protein